MNQIIEQLKTATGVKCANCQTCAHLGSDSDGGEPEYAISWAVCDKYPSRHYLNSFPFKKEMKCWEPEFWHSSFAGEIKTGEHEEVMGLVRRFNEAIESASIVNPQS